MEGPKNEGNVSTNISITEYGMIIPAREWGNYLRAVLGSYEKRKFSPEAEKIGKMGDADWKLGFKMWFYVTKNEDFERPNFISLVCEAYDAHKDEVLMAMDVGAQIKGDKNELAIRNYVIELFGGSKYREQSQIFEESKILWRNRR
jgi:hypothetical protein